MLRSAHRRWLLVCVALAIPTAVPNALAAPLPDVPYHLTARPWTPLETPRDAYLDRVEGIVRYEAQLQGSGGAIIDPVAGQEWQYATPYFANGVGVLLSQGRARDLLGRGVAAMDSVTSQMAQGNGAIPQAHGNFFVAPAAEALSLYAPFVSSGRLTAWRDRMQRPIGDLILPFDHNWRTYAMKGQWYRYKEGLVSRDAALGFIEDSWTQTQRWRFAGQGSLYHDTSSDPDTFAYEAAARANLWSMLTAGYDGPSASEMRRFIAEGTQSSLQLQDATGQAPVGGRSGLHTWNDVYTGLGYEMLAERAHATGDQRLAGQYRHAAMLALRSVDRWRTDQGYFSITKNHFPPSLRVRYADYSQLTNYNGNVLLHMAESWRARRSVIAEQPSPAEIGGYALALDRQFATATANAGGMQLEASLRGSTAREYSQYWNALGIDRFSRVNWDSRLGPSDGIRDSASGIGISYAPTFAENGAWTKLASAAGRYEASFTTTFKHPLLVRARIDYRPVSGQSGPSFSDDLVITPDGVLSTVTSSAAPGTFGVTWPLLVNDGAPLDTRFTTHTASVGFSGGGDEQNFIGLDPAPVLTTNLQQLRSSYGDLDPVRMVSGRSTATTFVYPRNGWDPSAEAVRQSFTRSGGDFASVLGTVRGSLYAGRTAAGGFGSGIDVDRDGREDVSLSAPAGFVAQVANGRVTAIEADRAVTATVQGRSLSLRAHAPQRLTPSSSQDREAEAGSVSGGAVAQDCGPCSGRLRVGFLGNGGDYNGRLTFTGLQVPVAGRYRLTLSYSNQDAGDRYATVTVNGTPTPPVAFPSTGDWERMRRLSVEVDLRAGANTVVVGNDTARAPSFDAIALALSREAEAGGLSGGALAQECAVCSGGVRVGFLGLQGSNRGTVTFDRVSVPAAGTYWLTLHYSNADVRRRTATLTVNEVAGPAVSFPGTGTWETMAPLQVPVQLRAGENTIAFGGASAKAPSLDRLVLNVP